MMTKNFNMEGDPVVACATWGTTLEGHSGPNLLFGATGALVEHGRSERVKIKMLVP